MGEAAVVMRCELGQIVKTTIYELKNAKETLVIVTSGEKWLKDMMMEILVDDELIKAEEDFIQDMTGYNTNVVPPLAHNRPIMTFIDEDIQEFNTIWTIGGDANAYLKLTPTEFKSMTLAEVVQVGF